MTPPLNILDHLADCAEVCEEDFPGFIKRDFVAGAHGHSSTTALIITDDKGVVWQVVAQQVAA